MVLFLARVFIQIALDKRRENQPSFGGVSLIAFPLFEGQIHEVHRTSLARGAKERTTSTLVSTEIDMADMRPTGPKDSTQKPSEFVPPLHDSAVNNLKLEPEHESVTSPASGNRFHDMDSLRAAMMLLGLVFHVAWFFLPHDLWQPISDSQGSIGFLYFFSWVHQFRMQVFILIAGFFSCLLIRKRGNLPFVQNRFVRIVIPFVLSMLTLWPLIMFQYLRGGLISGRIISDEPLTTQYWNTLSTVDWLKEWPAHLWFLECLILMYAISFCLKLAFDYVLDRGNKVRSALTQITLRLTRSHWGPFLLAAPVSVCMAYDLTWFGIETGPLMPLWAGIVAYWIFFAVGWCLYTAPQTIEVFVRRWPTYLLTGSILSFALCGYYDHLANRGRLSWSYPSIGEFEVDYPVLRTSLLEAAKSPKDSNVYGVIWNSLDPTYQDFLRDLKDPTSDQLVGFAAELTNITVLSSEFVPRLNGTSPTEAVDTVANRELLAELTGGAVAPRWTCPLWIRATYFYMYGLATWLMTFAMLGLFRQFFSNPSPTIRYLADSSFWLYLIHLPLQFELSMYLAPWEANGLLKFAIYNVLTFAISLPTYHYLVRPTWIGVLLNGRRYPIRQNPVSA